MDFVAQLEEDFSCEGGVGGAWGAVGGDLNAVCGHEGKGGDGKVEGGRGPGREG